MRRYVGKRVWPGYMHNGHEIILLCAVDFCHGRGASCFRADLKSPTYVSDLIFPDSRKLNEQRLTGPQTVWVSQSALRSLSLMIICEEPIRSQLMPCFCNEVYWLVTRGDSIVLVAL
jgi:hypothetical protein